MKLRFSIRDLLWLTLVIALCAGWFFSNQRCLKLEREMDQIYQGDVTLNVIDAETREPLNDVGFDHSTNVGRWAKGTTSSDGIQQGYRYKWIAMGPLEVNLSARGYVEKCIMLDQRSSGTIDVTLHRISE